MLSIGLMSGTSMDGIDAALLKTDGHADIELLGHITFPYPAIFKHLLKAAEYTVRHCGGNLTHAKIFYDEAIDVYLTHALKLGTEASHAMRETFYEYFNNILTFDQVVQHSTECHAIAVQQLLHQTGCVAAAIDVIGYHGQTFFHQPEQNISIIVGDGQLLANLTNVLVVNDFRSRDIAAGGQGAPFAPLYHHALALRDQRMPLAVVNCGGIANMSVIQNADTAAVLGFDTGPGNALVDQWVRRCTQGKMCMDQDGQFGQKGVVNAKVLQALYESAVFKDKQNYFSLLPPKSLDIGDLRLVPELDGVSLEDGCRTLEVFTAHTIAQSVKLTNGVIPQEWVLVGGGWYNPVIYSELVNYLDQEYGNTVTVKMAAAIGWNNQSMEAEMFAYFAVRHLHDLPTSMPGITGASHPTSGGTRYVPRNQSSS